MRRYLPLNLRVFTFCLIICTALSGCTLYRPLRQSAPAEALPEFYQQYYAYPVPASINSEVLGEEVTRKYRLLKVQFPLSFPEDLRIKNLETLKQSTEELAKTDQKNANDQRLRYMNRIDLYLPKDLKPGEKKPVILISPILGGNMVVDRFAKFYASRGYIAALVYRKKVYWDNEDVYPHQLENYLRLSIIRLRQAVDWLENQPEIDKNRIGAFGVSYGAILHTILAAVEPRIRYHVLAMPAAPLADVIIHCPDKGISKLVKHVKETYGYSKEKLYTDLQSSLKTDPEYLAPYAPKSKVQVYVAVFDRVVGASRSWHLWKRLGKPQLKVMPFGHYGGVLVFPYLQWQSYFAFKWYLRN